MVSSERDMPMCQCDATHCSARALFFVSMVSAVVYRICMLFVWLLSVGVLANIVMLFPLGVQDSGRGPNIVPTTSSPGRKATPRECAAGRGEGEGRGGESSWIYMSITKRNPSDKPRVRAGCFAANPQCPF